MATNLSAFQLFILAGAVAQAIQMQQQAGGDGKSKRANAIKLVITTVGPIVPAVRDNPEIAEHIGLLIDDFVKLGKKTGTLEPAKESGGAV